MLLCLKLLFSSFAETSIQSYQFLYFLNLAIKKITTPVEICSLWIVYLTCHWLEYPVQWKKPIRFDNWEQTLFPGFADYELHCTWQICSQPGQCWRGMIQSVHVVIFMLTFIVFQVCTAVLEISKKICHIEELHVVDILDLALFISALSLMKNLSVLAFWDSVIATFMDTLFPNWCGCRYDTQIVSLSGYDFDKFCVWM